jgi:hypothetical protein
LGLRREELRHGGGILRYRADLRTCLGAVRRGGGAGEGMDLTCGARMSVAGEREGGLVTDATHNRKCIPRSTPRALRPAGLGVGVVSCEKKGRADTADWASWAGP